MRLPRASLSWLFPGYEAPENLLSLVIPGYEAPESLLVLFPVMKLPRAFRCVKERLVRGSREPFGVLKTVNVVRDRLRVEAGSEAGLLSRFTGRQFSCFHD